MHVEGLMPVRISSLFPFLVCIFLIVLAGCGGGSGSGSGPGPQFQIVSGNWSIPLPNNSAAGGSLIQSGDTINGVLHVSGSSCFDPVADELIVTGKISNDGSNPVSFASAPIRGQVLTVSASNGATNDPPTVPHRLLNATASITGGACAGQLSSLAENFSMAGMQFVNGIPPIGVATGTAVLAQSAPDASGISHVTGTFTFTKTPCFASGTVSSSSVLGSSVELTINTDSGQLIGPGTFIDLDPQMGGLRVQFTPTDHGGPCDGQSFILLIN